MAKFPETGHVTGVGDAGKGRNSPSICESVRAEMIGFPPESIPLCYSLGAGSV